MHFFRPAKKIPRILRGIQPTNPAYLAAYDPQKPPPAHAAGLGASVFGQYPSLNQPLPFRLKAVAEIIFFT
jgi:hypothetical protein